MHHLWPTCSLCLSADRRRVVTRVSSWASCPGREHCQCTHMCPPPLCCWPSMSPPTLCHTNGVTLDTSVGHARRNILILRGEQLIRDHSTAICNLIGCGVWRVCLCRPIGRKEGCKIKRTTDWKLTERFWETDLKSETSWLTMQHLILMTETQVQLKSDILLINTFLKTAQILEMFEAS